MKSRMLLFFVMIVNLQLMAQEQIGVLQVERKIQIDDEFSPDLLYNKKTGRKVSKKELQKLIEVKTSFAFEPIYDNKGNIVKFLYDPDKTDTYYDFGNKESIEVGAYYPELILKDINGDIIKLKNLKGKMVILRFEMEADTFRFKKHEIEELDLKINESERGSEIESIIIFAATKNQILNGFDLKDSNFKLVANGFNFQRKLKINTFPTTIILDKQGKLMEELPFTSEGINILELLNKS